MIDWYSMGFGALWILGLGLVVAALSFANYLTSQQKRRFKQVLKMSACRITIDLGLVFLCLGLTGGLSAVWERLLWGVLALIFIVRTWQARKMSKI